MIQLVQPNFAVTGRIGWCLEYAGKVFGTTQGAYSAWVAWTQTQKPHYDRNIPTDVCVPLWFSYFEGGVNLGHVVISDPGVGFHSSPYQLGTTHAVLPSIEEVERIYGVSYVGWSEDILNLTVVEGGSMTREQAQQLSLYLRLLDFESVEQANSHSDDDVNHMVADPGYAGALAKQIYNGSNWQQQSYKASHYDADVANAAGATYTPYTGQLYTKK